MFVLFVEQYWKNLNMENEWLVDEFVRREDDDFKISNFGSMGVVGMLKNFCN